MGALDRRKKLAAEIEKQVFFRIQKDKRSTAACIYQSYMKRKGIDMEPKATAMLADFVGTDLSRLTGELEN